MKTQIELKKEFIDRQIKHIRLVQDYMLLLEMNLDKLPFKIDQFLIIERSFYHDLTKFKQNFIYRYLAIDEYRKNNTPQKDNLFDCVAEYYESESHHMEYHYKNGTLPTNLDICEMCCDMAANSDRNGREDYVSWFLNVLCKKYDFFNQRKDDFVSILTFIMQNKIINAYDQTTIESPDFVYYVK
jgi:hypothetical protein